MSSTLHRAFNHDYKHSLFTLSQRKHCANDRNSKVCIMESLFVKSHSLITVLYIYIDILAVWDLSSVENTMIYTGSVLNIVYLQFNERLKGWKGVRVDGVDPVPAKIPVMKCYLLIHTPAISPFLVKIEMLLLRTWQPTWKFQISVLLSYYFNNNPRFVYNFLALSWQLIGWLVLASRWKCWWALPIIIYEFFLWIISY